MPAPRVTATEPQLVRLAEDIYAWIGAGGDSNAGAIVTPDGILVIDAQQHEALARRFRSAVEREIGKPLRCLIDTHYHLDHTAGNVVFADAVPILAHEHTLRKLAALLGPRTQEAWTIADGRIKSMLLFGENLHDLVPSSDPAWSWFERRIADPEYARMRIAPP